MLTPAASADTVSRFSSPLCARWVATREEEQAVSVLMQGPAQGSKQSSLWADAHKSI
jgi:hypothetical protein